MRRSRTPAELDALARHRAVQQAKGAEMVENFAELLAEGLTITQSAKVLGLTQQRGSQIMGTIRAGLGWQAQ